MRYTGSVLTTVTLFLPGIALALVSGYYLSQGVYRMMAWRYTTGTITDVVIKELSDDYAFHEKAEFTDLDGKTIEVISLTGVDVQEDTRSGSVTILYNPKKSSEAIILQFRDYLIVFFLPFAFLLIYLGWPFEFKQTY
ncbi:MAG: DUF3592 domain-containing protein [Cyclobacteriaceae bacterium]